MVSWQGTRLFQNVHSAIEQNKLSILFYAYLQNILLTLCPVVPIDQPWDDAGGSINTRGMGHLRAALVPVHYKLEDLEKAQVVLHCPVRAQASSASQQVLQGGSED